VKITVAQFNPTVGDIDGNFSRIIEGLEQAGRDGSDLVVFPELFLTGYPPKDLLEHTWFIKKVEKTLHTLVKFSTRYPGIGIVLGAPVKGENTAVKGLFNAALLVQNGRMITSQHKALLPSYDVFDETRYFDPPGDIHPVTFKGEMLGISICEDAWNDPVFWPENSMYGFDPIEILAKKGATFFINISASPFTIGKEEVRFRLIANHAKRYGIPFLYVNQVGGNDELIFDGRSMFIDKNGKPAVLFPSFSEHLSTIDTESTGSGTAYVSQQRIESVYQALSLGLSDYMRKCGFTKAVVGLSGGIDSSVTASLACEVIGKENVLGIAMPSPFSSRGSIQDSEKLVKNLGIAFRIVPITTIYQGYLDTLSEHFKGKEADITEENIQARIRGNILMAFSNKYGYLVLSSGNKSELAVGYCTLYGDMSGGLAVISDVPKTMVYQLAQHINREEEIIPKEIIEKAPSAELRPDQKDEDTLPPYEILDRILSAYIEEGYSSEEIVSQGFNPDTVDWVINAVARNEYKRKQAAPGLKVTSKAFGAGRRMPIAAKYTV